MIGGQDVYLVCPACGEAFLLRGFAGPQSPCPLCGAMLERPRLRMLLFGTALSIVAATILVAGLGIHWGWTPLLALPLLMIAVSGGKPRRAPDRPSHYCAACRFDLRTVLDQGGERCSDCGAPIPKHAARLRAQNMGTEGSGE